LYTQVQQFQYGTYYRSIGLREFETPRFIDNRHVKMDRFSALYTSSLYPQEIFLVIISVGGRVVPGTKVWPAGLCQSKIAITLLNRTHDFPAYSTEPETTAPPRGPFIPTLRIIYTLRLLQFWTIINTLCGTTINYTYRLGRKIYQRNKFF
jgi:hypothetical protein